MEQVNNRRRQILRLRPNLKVWPSLRMTPVLMMLFFSPALADDAKTVIYSPGVCEFSITFPEAPETTKNCDNDDQSKCYEEASFTHTFDMAATVNFRAICNPIDTAIYQHYSAAVMEATLKEMTKKTVIKTFDTSFREEKGYKQAGLVGEGEMGRSSAIYIAQLWIGQHSALSLEAEMIGDSNKDADKLFSDVLKSVHFKADEAAATPAAPAATDDKKDAVKAEGDKKDDKTEEKK